MAERRRATLATLVLVAGFVGIVGFVGSVGSIGSGVLGVRISSADQDNASRTDTSEREGAVKVAVLPFAATGSLAMYGKPVADAVARRLSRVLPAALAIDVQVISLRADVPTDLTLVIDGRIVARGADGLSLEAHVRDPRRGLRLSSSSTRAGRITDIDQMAETLGDALARHIEATMRARTQRQDDRSSARAPMSGQGTGQGSAHHGSGASSAHAAKGATEATATTGASDATEAASAAGERPDARPVMVVFRVTGKVENDMAEVGGVAIEVLAAMGRSLGYRVVRSERQGILRRDEAADEVRARGGELGLMVDVRRVDFDQRRVLLARGRFRAVLVDAQGNELYDSVHRTHTLVGSRGDGPDALVRFVMNQMVDIIRPGLLRIVKTRREPGIAP